MGMCAVDWLDSRSSSIDHGLKEDRVFSNIYLESLG